MGFIISRKGQFAIIVAVVSVNLIFLITVGHVAVTRNNVVQVVKHVLSYDVTEPARAVFASKSTSLTTKHFTTYDPKRKKKVESIKQYLNESALTAQDFPAYRIGKYVMLNPNICKDVTTVDIVILVHTAPNHFSNRLRMRESFAMDSLFFPFHVRIAFLLGQTKNASLQEKLLHEHHIFNDTVQGEFVDDYHNLTLKGVMGYKWVAQYCPNAKIVLKIDDDVMVNMYKVLYSFTGHMYRQEKSIFCNVWKKSTMQILRNGKWKVSPDKFFRMNTFPYDYCSGFVVFMTSDLMAPLFEAAKVTPFFWIDDVYLFGMLPSVVGNVSFYNYALNKHLALDQRKAYNCTKTLGAKCNILATLISPSSYWDYWKMIGDIFAIPQTWHIDRRFVE